MYICSRMETDNCASHSKKSLSTRGFQVNIEPCYWQMNKQPNPWTYNNMHKSNLHIMVRSLQFYYHADKQEICRVR